MKDINLDFNPKQLLVVFSKMLSKLNKYSLIISIVIIVGIYGFLIMKISSASQQEPSQEEITLQLSTVKRLKIDQESIDKIQALQDQNVVVQSLFETARNNPFSE